MKKLDLKKFHVYYGKENLDCISRTLIEAKDEYSAVVNFILSRKLEIFYKMEVDLNNIPNTLDEIITKMKCDYNIVLNVESIEAYDIKLKEYSIDTLREQINMFDYYIKTADHSKPVKLIRIFFGYFTDVEMWLFKKIVENYESFDIFDLKLYSNKYKKVILNTDLLNNMKSDLESHLNNLVSELNLIKAA
jgi:DNA-binding Lrp family transcriptional regulator